MKKRQHLPLMAKLDMHIDIDRLLKEFFDFGYDDWSKYDGLNYDKNQEDGLVVRRILLEYFLTEEEKKERQGQLVAEGGEAYKMLCLTEFNGDPEKDSRDLASKLTQQDMDPKSLARRLEKISDPTHPDYVPIADEKRYDKRNEYCKGYVAEIMDMLEESIGHVARSRFAVLKAGEEIKPHLDVNTDKAVRIHIPLITHKDCTFGVQGKKRTVEEHMAADGSVWFINQGYRHWVKNPTPVNRVHLVFVITGQNSIENAPEQWWDVEYTTT